MDKGFVGFGPFTSPLPVRNKDQEALVRRGQVSGVMRQLFGLTAGLAGGWALLYGQLCPFALGLVLAVLWDRRVRKQQSISFRITAIAAGD